MTTFKEIRGNLIKSTSTDPANPQEGQIWYNSTSQVLKGQVFVAAAFSAGANVTQNKGRAAGYGTKTAALFSHGSVGPGPQPTDNQTYEYDGSTWTTGGNNNQPMRLLGNAGTQTSALAFGGSLNPNNASFPPAASNKNESYNGTSWSNETVYPETVNGGTMGFGDSESTAVGFGGNAPGGILDTTHEYNGSAWTAGGTMSLQAYALGGAGTQTAGLKTGRYNPVGPETNQLEEYNGTSWSTGTPSSESRSNNLATGGPQTAAFSAGGKGPGSPAPNIAAAESYDGTSWTNMANLANAGERGGSNLTDGFTNALVIGSTPYGTSAGPTEEFTAAFVDTKTFTTS